MAKKILHRIKRIAGWLLLCFFCLLFATGIFVYLKVPGYINKNLSGWVEKKTGGAYSLQFDEINLSITKWGLTIRNADFHPTGATDVEKVYYSFSSPEINIKNIGLLNLLLWKELKVGKLEALAPKFRVSGPSSDEYTSDRNLGLIFKELEPLLRKKIKSIRIKSIELINADYNSYNLSGQTTGKAPITGQITIGVNNFYTDSLRLRTPDVLFDADDIFIRISDYRKDLSDSLHILSADELYYSLKKEHITGKNVALTPRDTASGQQNRYFVKVPYLKLASGHIREFYISDSIRIDSLLLDRAEIVFYPKHKTEKITLEHISNFDLYELIGTDFSSVAINQFILNDARVKLFNYKNDDFLQQEIGQMKLKLENFYLDSASIDNPEKIFYSDHLSLSINNYQLILGDNYHRLAFGKLTASTDDELVRVYHARVQPISVAELKRDKKIAIEVECDSLKIRDADLKKAFHSRSLSIGGVELHRPATIINRYDTEEEKARKSSNLVYEMIADYFEGIYANLVTLENGQLQVNNLSSEDRTGYIRTGIDFQLTDFALDQISAAKSDKLFFATNIDLTFSEYEMKLIDQLHKMTIGKVTISSSRRNASVEQLHLFPVTRSDSESLLKKHASSELYEVKVPNLYFLNTDIHQAFFNKKLTIGNIRIVEPEINFESFANLKIKEETGQGIDEFYSLLSNYINDFDIRQIEAITGKLKLTNHSRRGKTIGFDNQFDLLLNKFRLNKNEIGKRKLFFSENIDLKIKKYLFRLSDKVHYLQVGEIGLSTFDSRVYAKNAILYPDIINPGYKKLPWNAHVTIPSVSLSGVDLLGIYFDGKLSADQFSIGAPDIRLYKTNNEKRDFSFKEFSFLLPDEIRELSIRDFQLSDGRLSIFKEVANNDSQFMGGLIGMQTRNLKIESGQSEEASRISSGIFTTQLRKLWLEPVGKNLRISLDGINYATSTQKISIQNLAIAPKKADAMRNQYQLKVPEIKLDAFDIDRAYTKSQYFFDQITLTKPEFVFYKNITDPAPFNPYTADLYPYFEDFADVFSIRQLKLENASFRFQTKEKTIEQSGVDLNLTGFKIDKNKDSRFLASDQFSFSFHNVTRYDPKKLYKFRFERIAFSSTDNHFVVSGIQLEPQYPKNRFAQVVGHQTDYFQGKLQEIRFVETDLQRWFEKQELVGKRLLFSGLEMDVYRDKRIPFNEKQRPPMPQDLIRNFGLKFYFDSLELRSATISYAEQIEESPEAGRVDFGNVNARLKPFTNIPYLIGITGKMQLDVSGKLMGEPIISAQVVFDMNSPQNTFDVQGNIAPCPMEMVNPMTKPAALMEINTGMLEKFEFQFTGDNDLAKGKLRFAYDDLNISILEIKDGFTRKSRFSSFMANSLLIKSKNPRGKLLLPDDINQKRDPSRSILNYWWKSIFSGIKNTFGIKEKEEK